MKLTRTTLERYRNWLLNDVIPGYQRQRDNESVRQSVIQLAEIEKKLGKFRYPKMRNGK